MNSGTGREGKDDYLRLKHCNRRSIIMHRGQKRRIVVLILYNRAFGNVIPLLHAIIHIWFIFNHTLSFCITNTLNVYFLHFVVLMKKGESA